ncbi:uncharacterized protein [Henckelia pumila]|uniref:uncharacterized protein n=1 Tax=Henckelia pumila TaxID=405737 RepID=UPI003C6E2EC2
MVKPRAYVVYEGKKPGVYDQWSEASAQVTGVPNSCHKGFDSKREAEAAFESFRKLSFDSPPSQQHQGSTSTPSAGSNDDVLRSRTLARLLQEQSDLAREIASRSFKMEKLCAEIRALLQEMRGN